jgi:multidrug efflux pump subunit AcrB
MNISEGFIKRPIATSLLMAAIALFGLVAYRSLPVSDLPNVDFPTLLVTAQLPGASPETMGASVATPLENQFSMIAGLESMTSVNSLGSTQITLEFDLNRSLDGAAVDVQAAITQAARLLPQGMPTPPTFTKVNPADQPILYLVITSTTVPPWTLDEYAETRIAQRISMVSGVAQVQVLGSQKYAVHAQLDPHKLAARQIGINEVENSLRAWNVNTPTGSIIGPHKAFTLQATGQLMNAAEYRDMIVAYRNGAPVRLADLGDIIDGVEDQRTGSWYYAHGESQRAITLGIQRQPGTNTIAVADAVKALLPQFRLELPSSVHMDVLYDRSDTIRESYRDVQFSMLLTLALVIMVIFVFLRNVWATVIPSLALPFSIIGTFAAMYMLGYSLDNLSMMALILSVGFVVDDAIVMLENIYRHVEHGEEPLVASLVGSKEIGFTIVSMTLSLAAVFIPVLFMGGVLGRLFREFSVTICVAILISGVVSVTLTPMLCSRFLKRPAGSGRSGGAGGALARFEHVTEKAFQKLLRGYDRTLQIMLRHRPATMAAFVVVLALTALLFVLVPKGFIPDQDTDQIAVTTEAAQGTAYDKLVEYQSRVADIISRDPNVAGLVSTIGGQAANTLGGPNLGQIVVHLKPRGERDELANDIIEKLRPELAEVPGMQVYLQNPPTVRIGGQVSKSLYQFGRNCRSARHVGAHHAGDWTADGEPQRAAAGRDDLVRTEARRVARRRVEQSTRGRRRDAARRRERPVRGRGESVSELARQPRRAAGHRRHGRLHRAWHPLRELHSPADDSLRSAVGRVRRARHADPVPHGPEHLRVRRHDHADRHRREERDHADRLRARSGARRQEAAGCDLRRMPDPLPADHDDDDGGPARRGADRARVRGRWRSAAAARPRCRGRPALLATCHALPHACCLHLHGAAAEMDAGAAPHAHAPAHPRRKIVGYAPCSRRSKDALAYCSDCAHRYHPVRCRAAVLGCCHRSRA